MPDLNFTVTGVEAAARGLTPLFHFKLRIEANPPSATIQALLLTSQIQIQCPQRAYGPAEKERLVELFGTPDRWGVTLRNRLWTHAHTTVGTFAGTTETILPVPCSYDLNIATAKYFCALDSGEIPLLFLFSGSVFYASDDAGLQVQPIPWSQECSYRIPVSAWRGLMEAHYPGTAWLTLQRGVFDRLYAYKRRAGLGTWEQTIEHLLAGRDADDDTDHESACSTPQSEVTVS